MYLKALEIQGFKSFPEKTRLSFEKDITVIVGPNGSGKSNISDALLWVMGEQKTRMLRGGKMEDVIFGGTEKRGAMGFAQVSLILDNSARVLNFDADEVSIARRYYRSGESEYYINKDQVRLKDVTELLMDTGLGCDGYSIIGQGRIAEIVSAKSTDRREIFEEAAGISRFRHRKDESERKLARTEENLLRIGDKISELEMQVGPLKEQSETAKKYLILRDELRVQEVSLWMYNLDRLHEQSAVLRRDSEKAAVDCTAARSEQDRLYAESERLGDKMRQLDLEAEDFRTKLHDSEAATAECENSAAVLRTNLQNNEESLIRMDKEIGEQKDRANVLLTQVDDHKKRIGEIEKQKIGLQLECADIRKKQLAQDGVIIELSQGISNIQARQASLNSALTENRTAYAMLTENRESMEQRLKDAETRQNEAETKLHEAEEKLAEARRELRTAQEKEQELSNIITGHTMLMSGRENRVTALQERHTKLTVECRSAESRIHLLQELEKEMEGFGKATKIVMQEASRGTLRGIHDAVAKIIRTEDRYALAVEIALGGHMGDIIVDTQDDGKNVLNLLKKREGGRVTCQPIDVVRGNRLRREPAGEPGYLGVCADLIETDPKYRNIIEALTGTTAVAESMTDAIRIARKYGNSFRIVTLDGQVINAGGSMTGGSAGRNTGILSRANELARLQANQKKLTDDLEKTGNDLREAERELERARYELETAREEHASARQECARQEGMVAQAGILRSAAENALDELEEEQRNANKRRKEFEGRMDALLAASEELEAQLKDVYEQLSQSIADRDAEENKRRDLDTALGNAQSTFASLDSEKSTVELAIAQLEGLRAELEGDSGQRRNAMELVRTKNDEIRSDLKTTEERIGVLRSQADSQREQVASLVERRMELEGRRNSVDKAAQQKNKELLELERTSAMLEQKVASADNEEQMLIGKLWDSYELSRTEAETVRQEVENAAKTARQVADLRRQMNALGNPNLGAIEEYQRVSQRYNFLSEQRDDVLKSKNEILNIIRDITAQMEEIFIREIGEIDAAFRRIFVELFGGGKAELSLEDANDVLNCGIDIRIQPPGKAVSNISLLSGGEKAFVAIALYFAIMKVRPTPFCMMDEIESALDEENVQRFAAYMRRMSDKTQFIAITHRRGTMDEADQLYGVTMQEKGVSTVISMDMQEALKTIR